MTEKLPVLGERQLRLAVLARQLLLDRAALGVPEALRRIGTIQAQHTVTNYVGLWSRLAGFRRAQLTTALEDRTAVLGWMFRVTLHLCAADDYWPICIAVRESRRRWHLRASDMPEADFVAAAERLRRAFAAQPVLTRKELEQVAGPAGLAATLWIDTVRVPPAGTWDHRRADRFADATWWVGPEPAMSVDDAVAHCVRRYLTGFGPASLTDVGKFLQTPVAEVRDVVELVSTRRFRGDDGAVLFDLDGLPLPDPATPVPVRFVGHIEAMLLAHARSTQILRDDDRSRVQNTKLPQGIPTFLVDGQVAGTWRYVDDHVEADEWRPLAPEVRKEVRAEADRLFELFG